MMNAYHREVIKDTRRQQILFDEYTTVEPPKSTEYPTLALPEKEFFPYKPFEKLPENTSKKSENKDGIPFMFQQVFTIGPVIEKGSPDRNITNFVRKELKARGIDVLCQGFEY